MEILLSMVVLDVESEGIPAAVENELGIRELEEEVVACLFTLEMGCTPGLLLDEGLLHIAARADAIAS